MSVLGSPWRSSPTVMGGGGLQSRGTPQQPPFSILLSARNPHTEAGPPRCNTSPREQQGRAARSSSTSRPMGMLLGNEGGVRISSASAPSFLVLDRAHFVHPFPPHGTSDRVPISLREAIA